MKKIINQPPAGVALIFSVTVAALLAAPPVNAQAPVAATHPANSPNPIPFDQLGAAAGKNIRATACPLPPLQMARGSAVCSNGWRAR